MDLLDLNNLASSLPSSTIARAEQETMDKFKAAAQSLTLLYRSSQKAAKRHFDAGYATALEDLLSVIQHGVSASSDPTSAESSEGVSIARILDWIEARQESIRIKAREEEEDEEERDNRNRSGLANKPAIPTLRTSGARDVRDKTKARSPTELPASSPPILTRRPPDIECTTATTTMQNPGVSAAAAAASTSPRSASPSHPSPASSPVVQPSAPSFPSSTRFRSRPRSHQSHGPLSTTSANPNHSTSSSVSVSPSVSSILGAKRRHAAMLLDAYPPPPATVSLPSSDLGTASAPISIFNNTSHPSDGITAGVGLSTPSGQRRRLRNSRSSAAGTRSENTALNDAHGPVSSDTIMDVEEEGGRERKRAARR